MPAEKTSERQSDDIIRRNALLAAGGSLIPVPLADLAAISGVQLGMIAELSQLYDIEFSRNRVKSIVSSLIGGIASREIATMGLGALLKGIPGVGTVLASVSMPAAAAAMTYAIGTVFRDHFSGGGDLGSLNLKEVRDGFSRQIEKGRQFASSLATAKSMERPDTKIYCILKPNIGKCGKVYLKTYRDGQRPEKYLGSMDELKARYGVDDLEALKPRIIDDHREAFMRFLHDWPKGDPVEAEEEPVDI